MTRRLPLELTGGEAQYLGLLRDEVEAIEAVEAALLADPSFEHLRNPDDDVWQFVGACWADSATDHIPRFIEEHSRKPVNQVCFMP